MRNRKKRTKVRVKSKIISIGTNADFGIDNIITLYRSSNDVFYGVLDYMFYKVLNCDPSEHNNLTELPFEYNEDELEEMIFNFEQYELKHDKEISKVLKKDIEKCIIYIRKKALKDGIIEEYIKSKYVEVKESYTLEYLIVQIMNYYKRGGN
jgi:RIO-like serine/threonine protein kinase